MEPVSVLPLTGNTSKRGKSGMPLIDESMKYNLCNVTTGSGRKGSKGNSFQSPRL